MKLEQIAKLAGVSRTTASYVVNGKGKQYRVSQSTIDKVMAVVEQYNYRPNTVAASLRAGKTHTIGLIIPDLENSSYAKIAMRLEHLCRDAGYQLLISCSSDKAEIEKQCVQQLVNRKIDALVVSTALQQEDTFYHQFKQLPIIGFDRSVNSLTQINWRYNDYQDSQHLISQLLEQYQPKSIWYFGAKQSLTISQQREQGFQAGLAKYQCDAEVHYIYASQFTREAAKETLEHWLSTHQQLPKVLFITSLSLLQGVLQTLLERKKQDYTQLIIATFGDPEVVQLLPNPLYCSVQPYDTLAQHLFDSVYQLTYKKGKTDLSSVQPLMKRELFIKA